MAALSVHFNLKCTHRSAGPDHSWRSCLPKSRIRQFCRARNDLSASNTDPSSDDVAGDDLYHVRVPWPLPLRRKSCGHSAYVRLPSNDAFRRLTFSSSMGNDQSHESMVCTRLCRNRVDMSGFHRSGQERLVGRTTWKLRSISLSRSNH